MSVEEYWTGKKVNYDRIWRDYLDGKDDYIQKFQSTSYHLLQIKFNFPDSSLPLINYEVICRTLMGCYHDLKQHCLPKEYSNLGPLFLYKVERGSGIFEFLGELLPLITLSAWLIPGLKDKIIQYIDMQTTGKMINNYNEYFKILDNAPIPEEVKSNLYNEGLSSIKVALERSFKGDIEGSRKQFIEFPIHEKKSKGRQSN